MSSSPSHHQDQPNSLSSAEVDAEQSNREERTIGDEANVGGEPEPYESMAGVEGEEEEEEHDLPTPPSPSLGQPGGPHEPGYLNDLPSLTPCKLTRSVSDSDSDSIPERFTDDDDDQDAGEEGEEEEEEGPEGLLDALSLVPSSQPVSSSPSAAHHHHHHHHHHQQPLIPASQRTPSSQTSLPNSHISLSEPAPLRGPKMGRKRSLSALVALRYRGGKGDAEIGDEERGLLALDLDTYINSGEPEIPETRALPPSALFPTLSSTLISALPHPSTLGNPAKGAGSPHRRNLALTTKAEQDEEELNRDHEETADEPQTPGLTISLHPDHPLLLPTPRSHWPFGGGTGPGNTSRGFIPGRALNLLSPTTPTHPSPSSAHNLPALSSDSVSPATHS
ncbi:hypothetical protein PGT21_012959 [Puccinia graminis f. sp. tritici]|uniref:Uncharacterized protein n=1 Tax=Puccinia graminis f. sp. tritici TaxID=56615 RepID=A0A5B0SE19_PUCGR|nr:hypothetical protein PGT21_012959 [Puccinia graminis f. sp. tritici]KAA1136032.1 hypothetical protein PGTUg99_022894 [Puccinia graminis f. sp. tritici]